MVWCPPHVINFSWLMSSTLGLLNIILFHLWILHFYKCVCARVIPKVMVIIFHIPNNRIHGYFNIYIWKYVIIVYDAKLLAHGISASTVFYEMTWCASIVQNGCHMFIINLDWFQYEGNELLTQIIAIDDT